jgi:inositol transport system permease protein
MGIKALQGGPKAVLSRFRMVAILLVMGMVITILRPAFLSIGNVFNVLQQASIFGIMALGMTLVIISKGIDISVGSVLAFAGIVAATLGQAMGNPNKFYPNLAEMPLIVPIIAALVIGGICGAVNGFFVAKTAIPAFIATLGMQTIARGFAMIYSRARPVSDLTVPWMSLGRPVFGFLPAPVIIYAIMIIITWILLNKTSFGKNVYAIGGNITAAEVSGINVSKNLIAIYTYCGLLAGLAGVVFAARVGSVHPGAANGYELTAIAATTIGGTSHYGGIGTIGGAVIGALILAVMRNGFTLLGVNAYWQQIAEGAIIIGAVVVDMRKNAKRN